MPLEFTDGFTTKDRKQVEEHWINHFIKKGLKLLNVTKPTQEPSYNEPKALLVYKADTLEFVGEFHSAVEASKKLKINQSNISKSITEKPDKNGCRYFSINGLFFFYKGGFAENLVVEKQKRLLEAKEKQSLARKKSCKLRSIKINQYSKRGEFIKSWISASEVQRDLKISPSNIISCCKNKLQTAGGFIWRYAESEKTS